jgi:hypothetical protein
MGYSPYYDVDVEGKYAFLSGYNNRLDVVDISQPSAPQRAGTIRTAGTGAGIFVKDNRIYLANGPLGFSLFEYTILPRPRLHIRAGGAGAVVLTVSDTSGEPFTIERTSNMMYLDSWQPVVTVQQPDPSFTFEDSADGFLGLYRVSRP